MKKLLLIILLLKVFQCEAQSIAKNSIELKDSTINRNITFEIAKGTQKIDYAMNGFLTTGAFSVSLTDPQGNQQGGFQLSAEINKNGTVKPAKGEMSKTLNSPMPGIWKLNIQTQKGIGQFTYQINAYY